MKELLAIWLIIILICASVYVSNQARPHEPGRTWYQQQCARRVHVVFNSDTCLYCGKLVRSWR